MSFFVLFLRASDSALRFRPSDNFISPVLEREHEGLVRCLNFGRVQELQDLFAPPVKFLFATKNFYWINNINLPDVEAFGPVVGWGFVGMSFRPSTPQ